MTPRSGRRRVHRRLATTWEAHPLTHLCQATGQIVERWAGGARIFAAGTQSLDDLVSAEPGNLGLLGARTLEGLNVAARIAPDAAMIGHVGGTNRIP